jgi:hypothetical protein
MSTEPPPPPPPPPPPLHQLHFTPIHRTVELENIHAQVTQNDLHHEQQQTPTTRKVLTKYMTVIGDGSDIDTCKITTQ